MARTQIFSVVNKESFNRNEIPYTDPNTLLRKVYLYYYHKGFWCIILKELSNVIIFVFMVLFITFLADFVNYVHLFDASEDAGPSFNEISVANLSQLTSAFLGISSIFFCILIFLFLSTWRETRQMKFFYNEVLKISENDIYTAKWDPVVTTALIKVHKKTPFLNKISGRLDQMDIAMAILREENFLIGMFYQDKINPVLPGDRWNHKIVTVTVEKVLRFVLRKTIFNKFKQDALWTVEDSDGHKASAACDSLRYWFIGIGALTILFAPLVSLLLLVFFLLKYGEMIKNKAGDFFGMRTWNRYYRWKIRDFNELPHFLDNRLALAAPLGNNYLDQFPSAHLSAVAKILTFIVGSIAGVIAVLTMVDQTVITKKILGVTLFQVLGTCLTILAVLRGFVGSTQAVVRPEMMMNDVVKHTRYKPNHWIGKEYTVAVRDEFAGVYELRVFALLREVLSIFTGPIILIFSFGLLYQPEAIVRFFKENTVITPSGPVYKFAHPDSLGKFGGKDWGVDVDEKEQDVYAGLPNGKMEKSFVAFMNDHPAFKPKAQLKQLRLKMDDVADDVAASLSGIQGLTASITGVDIDVSTFGSDRPTLTELHQSFHESLFKQQQEKVRKQPYVL